LEQNESDGCRLNQMTAHQSHVQLLQTTKAYGLLY